MLAEARYGFKGDVRASRGKAFELYTCAWGCGAKMEQVKLPEHETTHCPKRVVECTLECGIQQLWAEELRHHVLAECPRRPLPCTLGCSIKVEAAEMERHVTNACLKRKVSCTVCDGEVTAEKLAIHTRSECPMRHVAARCSPSCHGLPKLRGRASNRRYRACLLVAGWWTARLGAAFR